MTQYYVTVFLVGSYLPTLLGTEGVSEEQYFKQIWYNRLEKEYALPVFSQKFSPELMCRMKKGDILVLLNPPFDSGGTTAKSKYVECVRRCGESIGTARTVLAMQDSKDIKNLRLGGRFQLWPIQYAPIFNSHDNPVHIDPAPEEALEIVLKLLKGVTPTSSYF